MTLWICGTGRCGTSSAAEEFGGVHEPEPYLLTYPFEWHAGMRQDEENLRQLIRGRMKYQTCSDLLHSYIIPLILEEDKDAKFLWLIRQPTFFCRSVMATETWLNIGDYIPDVPPGKEPKTRLEAVALYWKNLNLLIGENLVRVRASRWEMMRTEDLKVHKNKLHAADDLVFTKKEQEVIDSICIYDYIQYLGMIACQDDEPTWLTERRIPCDPT